MPAAQRMVVAGRPQRSTPRPSTLASLQNPFQRCCSRRSVSAARIWTFYGFERARASHWHVGCYISVLPDQALWHHSPARGTPEGWWSTPTAVREMVSHHGSPVAACRPSTTWIMPCIGAQAPATAPAAAPSAIGGLRASPPPPHHPAGQPRWQSRPGTAAGEVAVPGSFPANSVPSAHRALSKAKEQKKHQESDLRLPRSITHSPTQHTTVVVQCVV